MVLTSTLLLEIWKAGVIQLPQLHWIPDQLKYPRRAPQWMHDSFPSKAPSSTGVIHFRGSTYREEQSCSLLCVWPFLLSCHAKLELPSPGVWPITLSCAATILLHFLQRYAVLRVFSLPDNSWVGLGCRATPGSSSNTWFPIFSPTL